MTTQKRTWRAWTTGEIRRAVELEARNFTQAEIAEQLGRSRSSVQKRLSVHGKKDRPRHDGLARHRDRLRELYSAGLGVVAISRKLSLDRASVSRWLHRLGLPSRPRAAGRPCTQATRHAIALAHSDASRARCIALGWPEASCFLHARILQALADCGPLTHAALAERLGLALRHDGGHVSGHSVHLANHLRRLGVNAHLQSAAAASRAYVVRLPPEVEEGSRQPRYAVADWLLARRSEEGRDVG